jgi:hypothetical protein
LADEIGKIVRQDVVPKFSNSETAASNIIFEVNMIGFKSSLNRRKKTVNIGRNQVIRLS